MHSPFAMMTLSPGARVVSASRRVPIISGMRYESTVLIHFTPSPRNAPGIVAVTLSPRALVPVDKTWCWPVAAA